MNTPREHKGKQPDAWPKRDELRKSTGSMPSLKRLTPGLDPERPLRDLIFRGVVWGRARLHDLRQVVHLGRRSA